MTDRELKAWDKAKAKAIKAAEADLKKSNKWNPKEYSKIYAYEKNFEMEQKNGSWYIKKFIFSCESHRYYYHEIWSWTIEVNIDLRKKAIIVNRNIKEE